MNRRGFLARATVAAATPALAGAQPVPGGIHPVERRGDFDARGFSAAVGRPAAIRQVYEAQAFAPNVLNSIKNSFNGLQFGFGYRAGEIVIALAAHGPSAVYGYSDYVWKKYRVGEFFDLKNAAGEPLAANAFVAPRAAYDLGADPDDDSGMYQDVSIRTLQRRGLIVLTCHTAVEEQARRIVARGFAPAGLSEGDVAADILTHLISGAIVVPSMVATLAVLQAKYGYAYLTPG